MTFDEYLDYCKRNKIDITKWKLSVLHEKVMEQKPLTEAEVCAKLFLEAVGYATWTLDLKKAEELKK